MESQNCETISKDCKFGQRELCKKWSLGESSQTQTPSSLIDQKQQIRSDDDSNFKSSPIGQVLSHETQAAKFKRIALRKTKITVQDRNTTKFIMRLFLKYNKDFSWKGKEIPRYQQIHFLFKSLCGKKQGNINLSIYEKLFSRSKYSTRNREVLFRILSDQNVMQRQLLFNKSVKNKFQYFFTCKIMRLRCRSDVLCERKSSH